MQTWQLQEAALLQIVKRKKLGLKNLFIF